MYGLEKTRVEEGSCPEDRRGAWTGWRTWLGRPLAVAACVIQAGCAASPDSIEARYVSPNTYQNWTCDQLVGERTRLSKEVQRVSGLQRENANADAAMMAVGLVLLWPVLFGLAATKDRKDELGQLKGEYDAVDLSIRGRQCTMPAPGMPSVPAPSVPSAAPAMPSAPPPASEALAATAASDGLYRGKGKTDSWCQTPSINLTLRGNAFEGELSELASGAPTSTVTGTLASNGVAGLEFKSTGGDYFGGSAEGAVKNNALSLDLHTRTARACSYHFELQRAPLSAAAGG
jgi:hypothetical protein